MIEINIDQLSLDKICVKERAHIAVDDVFPEHFTFNELSNIKQWLKDLILRNKNFAEFNSLDNLKITYVTDYDWQYFEYEYWRLETDREQKARLKKNEVNEKVRKEKEDKQRQIDYAQYLRLKEQFGE